MSDEMRAGRLDYAVIPLRLVLGGTFIAHGLQKLLGGGVSHMAGMLEGMGFHPGIVWAAITTMGELFGGIFVLLGLFSRIGCLLISSVMFVAMWKIHGPKGFFMMQGGYEYNLMILSVCACLFISGPGRFSVGRFSNFGNKKLNDLFKSL